MSLSFYPLRVKNIKEETADCVSVAFHVPEDLKQHFQFEAGQHLTFKKTFEGEELRRSYSICTSPTEQELRVAIKKVDQGIFSNYIHNQLKEGDVLETLSPQGLFTCTIEADKSKNYMFIAAGSGITPVIALIKTILSQEPKSRITLLYGNKNRASIIFKSQLEALKNKYMERLSLYHILSREVADAALLSGRIDIEKCRFFGEHLIDFKALDALYLCGPEEMIVSLKDYFIQEGVSENKIHFELFFSAIAAQKQEQRKQQAALSGNSSQVSITLDGSTSTIDLDYNGMSILDAALNNGADLPFACKGGVCATCRCKVEEGTVEMDVNYALEKDELERGFVLACQAHPRTAHVKINFDAR